MEKVRGYLDTIESKNRMLRESSLIVGGNTPQRQAFLELLSEDYSRVLIAHPESEEPARSLKKPSIHFLPQDFQSLDLADNIHQESELISMLDDNDYPLSILVNLMEFRDIKGDEDWEEMENGSSFSLPAVLDINRLFFEDMVHLGKGEILNIISRPDDCHELVKGMFEQAQSLLLDFSDQMNQNRPESGVHVHILSYTPNSFLFQTENLPSLAHDLSPKSFSANDIATFGYQATKIQKGLRNS